MRIHNNRLANGVFAKTPTKGAVSLLVVAQTAPGRAHRPKTLPISSSLSVAPLIGEVDVGGRLTEDLRNRGVTLSTGALTRVLPSARARESSPRDTASFFPFIQAHRLTSQPSSGGLLANAGCTAECSKHKSTFLAPMVGSVTYTAVLIFLAVHTACLLSWLVRARMPGQ